MYNYLIASRKQREWGLVAAESKTQLSNARERTFLSDTGIHRPAEVAQQPLEERQRLAALHRSRGSRNAVCSPVRRNSIGGESGRVDGLGGSEVHASTEVTAF